MSGDNKNKGDIPFLVGGLSSEVRERFMQLGYTNGKRNTVAPLDMYTVVAMDAPYKNGVQETRSGVIVGMHENMSAKRLSLLIAPIKQVETHSYSSDLSRSDLVVPNKALYSAMGFEHPLIIQISEQEAFEASVDPSHVGKRYSVLTGQENCPMICGRKEVPEVLHKDLRELQESYLADLQYRQAERIRMSDGVPEGRIPSAMRRYLDFGLPDDENHNPSMDPH